MPFMSDPCSRAKGLTLLQVLVLCVVVLVIIALGIVGLHSSQQASNERNASTSLKTLTSAEADFRANDRDWNHINDFWTADVKGLYTLTSCAVKGALNDATDPAIKLIDLTVAGADADSTFYPAGGENVPFATFGVPGVKSGYWYAALLTDRSQKPESPYKVDTGGTTNMGKVHNTLRFGFAAIPDSSWNGNYVFIVNENNTIFREAITGKPRAGTSVPPGLDAIPDRYLHFPDDASIMPFWRNVD